MVVSCLLCCRCVFCVLCFVVRVWCRVRRVPLAGCWLVAAALRRLCCLLFATCWLLFVVRCSSCVLCLLFVVPRLTHVVRCVLFVVCRLLCAFVCWSLFVYRFLFVVWRLLFDDLYFAVRVLCCVLCLLVA